MREKIICFSVDQLELNTTMKNLKLTLSIFILFYGISAFAAQGSHSQNFQTAMTSEGPVLGQIDKKAWVFKNIPYADPPVGQLRWKAPTPPTERSTLWNGQNRNPSCPQIAQFFSHVSLSQIGQVVGSEDCLYLNIWKPKNTDFQKDLPVIVWLHGGSNRYGTASDPLYDGANLADKTNSVVVTINYRLGALGAFYHPALESKDALSSSGNFVTLDIIQALKWIKKNISHFNGDKKNITLAGESAGGINVWGLLQSPLSKNLFHKAYIASGIPNAYPPSVAQANSDIIIDQIILNKNLAANLAAARAYQKQLSQSELKNLLLSTTTEEIIKASSLSLPISHISDGVVIPIKGLSLIPTGHFQQMPMMIGTMKNETAYFLINFYLGLSNPEFSALFLDPNADLSPLNEFVTSPRLLAFQAQTNTISQGFEKTLEQLLSMVSVYTSVFKFQMNWGPKSEPWKSALGPTHGMDLPIFFGHSQLPKNHYLAMLNPTLDDPATQKLTEDFLSHLKSFIYSGKPKKSWPSWTPVIGESYSFSTSN